MSKKTLVSAITAALVVVCAVPDAEPKAVSPA